jgi:hypothetical protein
MSHWDNAPRRNYIMVHHTGSPNAHQDNSTNYCSSGYDFHIRWGGEIVVCARWNDSTGAHASGCNCKAIGVMLNGCFGGCSSGNVTRPSNAQECSLAYIFFHLNTPVDTDRMRPHRACYYWNPCNDPSPTSTVCCGANLTDANKPGQNRWSDLGVSFRNDVFEKRRWWAENGCCDPSPCPP